MDYINYQPTFDNYTSEDGGEEMELEITAIEFGSVEKILDFDGMKNIQELEMEEAVNELAERVELVSIKKTRKYKNYGPSNIERFIYVMQEEGLSVPKAAQLCGIPRSTAYELLNEFNESNGTVLPGNNSKKPSKRARKLLDEHSAFLISLFDSNPSTVLEEAKIKLCEAFPGLTVSVPGLYKHITEKCALSLKQASKYIQERDALRTLKLRFDITMQWKAAGVDYRRNCVFVDEAGFHM